MALSRDSRTLLDLLCLVAPMSAELDRAFRLKPGWGDAVDALRNRGLVAFDSLTPSPSALADFADRQSDTPSETSETPPSAASETNDTNDTRSSTSTVKRSASFWRNSDHGWSPERQEKFLGALASTGTVAGALKAVGLGPGSQQSAYKARDRQPDFRRRWDEIMNRVLAERRAATAARRNAAAARRAAEAEAKRRQLAETRKAAKAIVIFARRAGQLRPAPPARSPKLQRAPKPNAWDRPERQDAFIEALEATGTVGGALKRIGKANSAQSISDARRRGPDFDRRCQAAIAAFRRPEKRAKPGGILTRAGASFADNFGRQAVEEPRPWKPDAEIAAETLRFQEERRRLQQLEPPPARLSLDDAKLTLQRRGFSVCRANVVGGREDRWAVGSDRDVTDEQLVERARRILERMAA